MLPLIKTTDTRAYVHTADPSVTASGDTLLEWIPASEAEAVADDATRVYLRPLNSVEYFTSRAALVDHTGAEYGAAIADIVKLAVVRVEHYDGELAADLPGPVLDDLAAVILSISGRAT